MSFTNLEEKNKEQVNSPFYTYSNEYSSKIYGEDYKRKLSDFFYSEVVSDKHDMVIGPKGEIICFETKIVIKRYIWDPKSGSFKRVPSSNKKRDTSLMDDEILEEFEEA